MFLAITALLLVLAFPHPGWGWCAHVALAPAVLLALRSGRRRRLVWVAYVVSLLWWLFMLRWLAEITTAGYVGLCVYLAIFLPVALLLVRHIERRFRLPMVLVVPMVWVSLEYLRSHLVAGGFGWFTLAHSQAPYLPAHGPGYLIQTADLFGELTVSFLVCMTGGLIVDLLHRPWVRPGRSRPRISRMIRAAVVLYVAVMIGAYGYGRWRVAQAPDGDARRVAIGVVQTNVPQDVKDRPTPESAQALLRDLEALTRAAAAHDPRPLLIVWPETIVSGELHQPNIADERAIADAWAGLDVEAMTQSAQRERYQRMADDFGVTLAQLPDRIVAEVDRRLRADAMLKSLSAELGVALVVGSSTAIRSRTDGDAFYNSAYLYDAQGRPAEQRYDKLHLVPFGEYVPWVGYWPWLKRQFVHYLTPYDRDYSLHAGTRATVFIVDGGDGSAPVRVATPICFEDVIPRATRRLAYARGEKRADLLVNLTNDGWYTGTTQRPQHLQISTLRCIEMRLPMARSVNTGVSGFVDSSGRVGPLVADADGRMQRVAGYAVAQVTLDKRVTWFGWWGEWPVLLLTIMTLGLAVLGRFRRSKMV